MGFIEGIAIWCSLIIFCIIIYYVFRFKNEPKHINATFNHTGTKQDSSEIDEKEN